MAKKGERKQQKRMSVESVRKLAKKEAVFTLRSRAGPHSKSTSVPLGFALRDLMGLTRTSRETRILLMQNGVIVNGTVRKNASFPVGLFDLVDVMQLKKRFRAIFDRKGRIEFIEADFKQKPMKLSRIVGKKTVKSGIIQLATNDGFVLKEKKTNIRVGDTVRISLPDKKIEESYELKEGNTAFIVGGVRAGAIARIKEIIPGTIRKPKLIRLEQGSEVFETVDRNVFIVGRKEPAIDITVGGAKK